MTHTKSLQIWLFFTAACVFAMMIIGAITRLTESGLSMVEWRPLIGALPPLSEEEWTRVFGLYKASPEFQKENFWMELNDFKRIFFWEWFHRLWGRMIGLIYALPMIWFWVRGKVPAFLKPRLILLLILGGCQGLMGWYMVQSGLVDRPDVSHFRLAAHLFLAFLLYGMLIWTGLLVRGHDNELKMSPQNLQLCRYYTFCLFLLFIPVMLWGAMTAGLDAGLIYGDEFPTMGGRLIPAEVTQASQVLSHPVGVQFLHRWLAVSFVVLGLCFWGICYFKAGIRSRILNSFGLMLAVQAGLGISTLFSGVALPLAVAHQAGAIIILTLLVLLLFRFTRDYKSSSTITGT